jgi:hypothetical protein
MQLPYIIFSIFPYLSFAAPAIKLFNWTGFSPPPKTSPFTISAPPVGVPNHPNTYANTIHVCQNPNFSGQCTDFTAMSQKCFVVPQEWIDKGFASLDVALGSSCLGFARYDCQIDTTHGFRRFDHGGDNMYKVNRAFPYQIASFLCVSPAPFSIFTKILSISEMDLLIDS